MRRICAWCGRELGSTEDDSDGVTHGVCHDCAKRMYEGDSYAARDFLDMLDAPVMLLDGEGRVLVANRRARLLAGKPVEEIEGFLCGDVFLCVNAHLPDACGKSKHCPACAVRASVVETCATGRRVVDLPVYLDVTSPKGIRRRRFRISTDKVAESVLLRIVEE